MRKKGQIAMVRPVILLDCDGPLADFAGAYLRALDEETGYKHTPEEVDRWEIHDCAFFVYAARQVGLEPSELRRRVDAHVLRPGFCDSIQPQPGVRIAVEKLKELGDVYVVTSPWYSSTTWMHERLHWCARKYGIHRAHVIQAGRKHLIRGDVFVDDKPSHVEEWARHWPEGKAILFDMPHNRSHAANLARGGWDDVLQAVEGLRGNSRGGCG